MQGKKKQRKTAMQTTEKQMTAKQKIAKQWQLLPMRLLQDGSSLRAFHEKGFKKLIDLQLPRIVDPDWMAVAETPEAVEVP